MLSRGCILTLGLVVVQAYLDSPLPSAQRPQVVKDARPGGSHEKGPASQEGASFEQVDLSFEEEPSYSQFTEEEDDYMSMSHAFHRLGE